MVEASDNVEILNSIKGQGKEVILPEPQLELHPHQPVNVALLKTRDDDIINVSSDDDSEGGNDESHPNMTRSGFTSEMVTTFINLTFIYQNQQIFFRSPLPMQEKVRSKGFFFRGRG